MGKLKNLSLNRKYFNKCSKDVFLSLIETNHIDCKVKEVKTNEIIFLTNTKVENNQIESYNRIKYHFKYTFLKHLSGIMMIILSMIILLISGSFIREIKFADSNQYNEAIYQDVFNHLRRKGPFYLLDDTPSNISLELREKYPQYAWIGITVNYSDIIIDIEPQDVPKKENITNTKPCDLISGYDAVVTGINVKNGVVMVIINQSVKVGDVLVSGNLLIENGGFDKDKLVSSNGVIIGKTLVLDKIKVFKKEERLEYTGRVKKIKRVSLFGKDIGKNPVAFDNYYTKINPLFNLFNILQIVEISYYEQSVITSIFDKDQAVEYAKKKIYYDFEKQRTSSLEQIDNVQLVDVLEFEDYYMVSFITTKHINIVKTRYYEW